jgi:predicted N-acetyltransferase YhbS
MMFHPASRVTDLDAPRPRRLGDTDRLAAVLAESFGFDSAGAAKWLRSAGAANWRCLRSSDETALAWLLVLRAGLHFGGREVSTAGIAAVCAPAEHRGEGAARRLPERTLHELHAAGDALALLHPVMNELYRRVGFEPAGSRWRATAQLADVRLAARSPSIRQLGPADAAVVRRLYAERAASQPGFLARSDYLWSRLQTARTETRRGDRRRHPSPRATARDDDRVRALAAIRVDRVRSQSTTPPLLPRRGI